MTYLHRICWLTVSCVQMVSSLQHGFLRVLMTPEVLLWCKEILAGSAHHSCVGLCSVSTSCGGGGCAAQQCSSHWQKTSLSTWLTLPVPNNHWKSLSVTGISSLYVVFLHVETFFFQTWCVSHLLSNLCAFMTQQDLGRGQKH